MPRFFFYFNYLTKKMTSVGQSRRAADSGFVGVLVCSSGRKPVKDGQKATEAHLLLRRYRSHVQTLHGQTLSQKRHNFSHEEAKAPNSKMLPSLGNRRARMICTGKMT